MARNALLTLKRVHLTMLADNGLEGENDMWEWTLLPRSFLWALWVNVWIALCCPLLLAAEEMPRSKIALQLQHPRGPAVEFTRDGWIKALPFVHASIVTESLEVGLEVRSLAPGVLGLKGLSIDEKANTLRVGAGMSKESHTLDMRCAKLRVFLSPHHNLLPFSGDSTYELRDVIGTDAPVSLPVKEIVGGQLQFKIISTVTGRPLPEHRVVLWFDGGSGTKAATDEQGIVVFQVSDKKSVDRLESRMQAGNLERFRAVSIQSKMFLEDRQPYTIRTIAPYVIGQVLTRSSGDESVRFSAYSGVLLYSIGRGYHGLSWNCRVRDGRYAIYKVAERRGRVLFRLPDDMSSFYIKDGAKGPWVDPEKRRTQRHSLLVGQRHRTRLSVSVVDELTQEPVEDAKVVLLRRSQKSLEQTTRENGKTVFRDLLSSKYRIVVEANGYSKRSKVVCILKPERVKLSLPPYIPLRLEFVDAEAGPLVGARIMVGEARYAATTDRAGRCMLNIPPGSHVLVAAEREPPRIRYIGRLDVTKPGSLRLKCPDLVKVSVEAVIETDFQNPRRLCIVDRRLGVPGVVKYPSMGRTSGRVEADLLPRLYDVFLEIATRSGSSRRHKIGGIDLKGADNGKQYIYRVTEGMLRESTQVSGE
jgi:hypothetical protein